MIWHNGWQRRSSLDHSVLRSQQDRGNPVIVGKQEKSSQNYVVVYWYSNGGSRTTEFMTMDPCHSNTTHQQQINNYGLVMRYHA